jgi:IS30 family transposase
VRIECGSGRQSAAGRRPRRRASWRGCHSPVAYRWFRHAGGVNPALPPTVSGRYLSFAEREDIALWRAQMLGVREIARRLGRSPSTISRELRRNASTRTFRLEYKASTAQWHAERRARRPKIAKMAANTKLRHYVQDRLSGLVRTPGGRLVGPPGQKWNGKNKPHRADRRWVKAWSPEQIAKRLPVDFPDDESMRISHEAIYQALYVQGRGALKRELVACLRTGRALRVPRARSKQKAWAHVTPEVMISERPPEANDRAVPGHWEGDLIIGLERSAIGTLVERTTRFTMLIHLPREEGYRHKHTPKNGPALAGYGAVTMKDALAATMTTLPEQLRRSLTWDRGKELSRHAVFRIETGIPVFFADPPSPWQRGSNENTNGLLRQYFPKGTDLSRWKAKELQAVANTLNNRPRKTLGWKTPAEALNEHLLSVQ